MGLLTQILGQKIAQHHQDEVIARNNRIQANLGLAHANFPLDQDPDKDAQLRQYYADLATKDMEPDAKKTYQRGSALMGFFHNVLGHQDPAQPQQPSPANALVSPNAQAPAPSAQGVDLNPGIDIGAGSALPSRAQGPSPGPVSIGQGTPARPLAAPDFSAAASPAAAATPPAPAQFNPATANPYAGYNPAVQAANALRINKARADAIIGPDKANTAAYQEILATGGPSTVITERAKLQAVREEAQNTLDELEKRGIKVPDWMKAEVLSGKNLGAAAAMKPVWSPSTARGENAPPGTVDMTGRPVAPGEYRVMVNPYSQEIQGWMPASVYNRFIAGLGPNGQVALNEIDPRNPNALSDLVQRGVTPVTNAQAAPKTVNLRGGGVGITSGAQAAAGTPITPIPGTVGSGDVSTSTQTVPGQLPQTTRTQRGGPARPLAAPVAPVAQPPAQPAVAPARTAPAAGPAASAVPGTGADQSVIADNYRDWVAGKATLSPKEQTAARFYAQQHNLTTPEILNASGQKAVATIQPILEEVQRAKKMVEDLGLDKMSAAESKVLLGKEWAKYRYAKVDSPLAKIISDLSFDSLRGVGQALQGTGTRAYPIFQRALEHTPSLGLNSDDGPLIHDKLTEMETRLQASLDAAKEETKSGVVRPTSAAADKVEPIQLKDGRSLIPHSKEAADKFRKDHPELIK